MQKTHGGIDYVIRLVSLYSQDKDIPYYHESIFLELQTGALDQADTRILSVHYDKTGSQNIGAGSEQREGVRFVISGR